MVVIRLIGVILLILALLLLGADAVTSLEQGGGFATRSLDYFFEILAWGSLSSSVEANLPIAVATFLVSALSLPAWLLIGGLAIILVLISSFGGRDD